MSGAGGWLRRLAERFGGKSAVQRLELLPGIRRVPPRRGTPELLRAYSDMPWLRAATARIAYSIAAVPWRVFRAEGERRIALPQHPLQRLLEAGSTGVGEGVAGLTGLDLRKATSIHLDLVGEAFWLLERNGVGLPIAALPLPPHWVLDLARPERPTYLLSLPDGLQAEVGAADVVLFRDIDPFDPFGRGSGTAGALADELNADEFAAKYVSAFLANRARPDIIVSGSREEPLTRDEAQRMEAAWTEKFTGPLAGGRPFFSSGTLEVKEIGQSFRDTQLKEVREFERDTIVSVFGLPPEKLGILANSNRSTIEAADLFFAKEVLLPRLRLMREVMQQRLAPLYGPDILVDFDSPVEADAEFRRKVMADAPQHFCRNDFRRLAGLPPVAGGEALDPAAAVQPRANEQGVESDA